MINGNIELYENTIKFPNVNEKTSTIAHLVYITPNVGNIVEHAGRTCYRSFNSIKEDSYKTFIANIVKSGHESVIEHSNMVYIILKTQGKELKADSDHINRYLINVMMYNGLIKVTESQAFYVLSGNIRMFKDLVREYVNVKSYNNKVNPIIDDIIKSFYTLPDYFFIDMINSHILDRNKFKLDPHFKESNNVLKERVLNEYVSVISHTNFDFEVRGFITTKDGDTNNAHRISIPQAVLNKHNRITVIIDAPRYITHQIVRHRLASYSQASQRYCLEKGLNVYVPESIKANPAANAKADFMFRNALATYADLVELDIKKEDARSVLTNAQMSTIVMTATVEEFKHFIDVRADKAAQNFIRDEIAVPLKEYLEKYYSPENRCNISTKISYNHKQAKYNQKQERAKSFNKKSGAQKQYKNNSNQKHNKPSNGKTKSGNTNIRTFNNKDKKSTPKKK
jgi:thymidylate synthase ThyX